MKISTNQFSKKVFSSASGFTDFSFDKASGFVRKTFTKGTEVWGGDNTSEGAYGVEDMFGGVDSLYGESPYSSMAHFKLRETYTISR